MVTGCLVAGTEWNQGGLEQVHGTMTSNIFLWEQNERTTAGVEFQHTEKEAKNNNKKKISEEEVLKVRGHTSLLWCLLGRCGGWSVKS